MRPFYNSITVEGTYFGVVDKPTQHAKLVRQPLAIYDAYVNDNVGIKMQLDSTVIMQHDVSAVDDLDSKNIIGLTFIPNISRNNSNCDYLKQGQTKTAQSLWVVFIWDTMPISLSSIPCNDKTIQNLLHAIITCKVFLATDNIHPDTATLQILQTHVHNAIDSIHADNIVHASRELITAKDRALLNNMPPFMCSLLTFTALYSLRMVTIQAVLFDDLCSVASAEFVKECVFNSC